MSLARMSLAYVISVPSEVLAHRGMGNQLIPAPPASHLISLRSPDPAWQMEGTRVNPIVLDDIPNPSPGNAWATPIMIDESPLGSSPTNPIVVDENPPGRCSVNPIIIDEMPSVSNRGDAIEQVIRTNNIDIDARASTSDQSNNWQIDDAPPPYVQQLELAAPAFDGYMDLLNVDLEHLFPPDLEQPFPLGLEQLFSEISHNEIAGDPHVVQWNDEQFLDWIKPIAGEEDSWLLDGVDADVGNMRIN